MDLMINMNNCKIFHKIALFHQMDCFASLSKMWLSEQLKLDSTKVLSTGLIVSICLGLSLFSKAFSTWVSPGLSVGPFICLCDLLDLWNGSFKLKKWTFVITLEAKMKISYSLAILNIINSFNFDKHVAIAYLIALTWMLIVFGNVGYLAYKLICFSYSVVIVRAQININTEDTDFS